MKDHRLGPKHCLIARELVSLLAEAIWSVSAIRMLDQPGSRHQIRNLLDQPQVPARLLEMQWDLPVGSVRVNTNRTNQVMRRMRILGKQEVLPATASALVFLRKSIHPARLERDRVNLNPDKRATNLMGSPVKTISLQRVRVLRIPRDERLILPSRYHDKVNLGSVEVAAVERESLRLGELPLRHTEDNRQRYVFLPTQ